MDAPRYPLASVDNALKLILLVGDRRLLRLSDAATELGVARSTAHRLLAALQHRDFVRQDPVSKAYMPGPAFVRLGRDASGLLDLSRRVRPFLGRVARETGETSHLCILEGRETLFLDSVESERMLRTGSRTGLVLPAHCTSGGKAMLAQLPIEEVRGLYGGAALEQVTDQCVTTLEDLEAELRAVADRGYATNFGESEPDVVAVAVAVRSLDALPPLSLAASGPASRMDEDRIAATVDVLRQTVTELDRHLADGTEIGVHAAQPAP